MSAQRTRRDDGDGSSKEPQRDAFIGLDVGGTLFYCHRSTLTNATGSYFASRFRQDSLLPAGDATTDDRGRDVYSIDRSGELFGHILDHLRMAGLPWKLPKFHEDPKLWRGLRAEAQFYGLQGLSALLHVTHTCSPDLDGDRGVLYWLGTEKGTREYRNPHAIGAVHVGGWVDMTYEELAALDGYEEHRARNRTSFEGDLFSAEDSQRRELMVQYRPKVNARKEPSGWGWHAFMIDSAEYNMVMFCDHGHYMYPAVVDMRNIHLKPTHYSLRWEACGMRTWNFEASLDGQSWDVLHEARGDKHLVGPSPDEMGRLTHWLGDEGREVDEDARSERLLSYAEKHHRHTWALDPPASNFYRYFRFIGAADSNAGCLHGVGLELYGDIHES